MVYAWSFADLEPKWIQRVCHDEDDTADEIGAPISNVTKSKSTGTINGNGKNMLLKALNANASIAPETTTTVTETKNTEEHNNKSSGNSSGISSSSSRSSSSSSSSSR